MADITHPTVHGHYAALVTHPGYYYLYALYADYPINNAWFRKREYAALLSERLRTIQPLLALVQPYRKSPALRMFTERRSRDRFPPELANEAWRELRQMIERIGPPAGWPDGSAPPEPQYLTRPPQRLLEKKQGPLKKKRDFPPGEQPDPPPESQSRKAPDFPKSPVDYSRKA